MGGDVEPLNEVGQDGGVGAGGVVEDAFPVIDTGESTIRFGATYLTLTANGSLRELPTASPYVGGLSTGPSVDGLEWFGPSRSSSRALAVILSCAAGSSGLPGMQYCPLGEINIFETLHLE